MLGGATPRPTEPEGERGSRGLHPNLACFFRAVGLLYGRRGGRRQRRFPCEIKCLTVVRGRTPFSAVSEPFTCCLQPTVRAVAIESNLRAVILSL